MSYDNLKRLYSRVKFTYCEIEVNGQKFTFCDNTSQIPIGFTGVPTLRSKSLRPSQINLEGGIGVRASASISFDEHLDYVAYGTVSNPVRFWINWRARNPGYQGGRLSIFDGYIPEDGVFDVSNFVRRDYVIESFSNNASGVTIGAKDALKLTSGDRAKAPRKSTGLLTTDILATDTSFSLIPAGVGDSEYPSSGWGRLGDEVVSFTRTGDNFTVVRAQYNTLADEHSANDVLQLCLYYNDTVSNIIFDLLTNYASVPTAQIDKAQWDNETSLYLPGLFESLITEPTGVDTLLKELGESAPHSMYWDERTNLIPFIALKEPPSNAVCFTTEANILENSFSSTDENDMRISTVIVRFGQYDPTKELDETSNYRQAHVRITPDSIVKYGGIEKYKVINSRWINNSNRAAAVRLAARFGRRFEETPRRISFQLDAKDSNIWTGDNACVNVDTIVDENGNRFDMPIQILTAGESKSFNYTALEHIYGDELPEDLGSEDPNQRLVVLSGELTNINLRTIYNGLFPDVTNDYDIVFVFDSSCVVGSTSTSAYSIETGSWPEITTGLPIKLDNRFRLLGKGGKGADVNSTPENGGPAINLNTDIRLTNTGIIGGGGAGGRFIADLGDTTQAAGGGGAGFNNGLAGQGTSNGGNNGQVIQAQEGTALLGGIGGLATTTSVAEPSRAEGEDGGDLGQSTAIANAGKAISLNGNTITYLETGDIRGAIS
ncbi:MAG: hypothetical protein ABNH21_06535 [Glaciecola sp.]